jgi:hypothetical protein
MTATTAQQLANEYCAESPGLGQIVTRGGRAGVLFIGPDDPAGGTFIPFDWLGYNSRIGFFDKRLFKEEPSL